MIATCGECGDDYDTPLEKSPVREDEVVCENCLEEIEAERRVDMHEEWEHLSEE